METGWAQSSPEATRFPSFLHPVPLPSLLLVSPENITLINHQHKNPCHGAPDSSKEQLAPCLIPVHSSTFTTKEEEGQQWSAEPGQSWIISPKRTATFSALSPSGEDVLACREVSDAKLWLLNPGTEGDGLTGQKEGFTRKLGPCPPCWGRGIRRQWVKI